MGKTFIVKLTETRSRCFRVIAEDEYSAEQKLLEKYSRGIVELTIDDIEGDGCVVHDITNEVPKELYFLLEEIE